MSLFYSSFSSFFFLMIRRPPRSTRTDTLFPYTTLFRCGRIIEPGHPVSPADIDDITLDRRHRAHRLIRRIGARQRADPRGDIVRPRARRPNAARSEARRVGKEGVSTCRSRLSPCPSKKNKLTYHKTILHNKHS